MMEVNATTVVAASIATEVDPTHSSSLNQVNPPVSDMVGQGGEALGSTGSPHVVQRKNSFPPYSLPPNYTPPIVEHSANENINDSTPILIESQQPQSGHAHVSQPMGEAHEAPQDHNLVDFEPHLGYAAEGKTFCGIPVSCLI